MSAEKASGRPKNSASAFAESLHAFAVVRMRAGLALQIAFEIELRRQVVVSAASSARLMSPGQRSVRSRNARRASRLPPSGFHRQRPSRSDPIAPLSPRTAARPGAPARAPGPGRPAAAAARCHPIGDNAQPRERLEERRRRAASTMSQASAMLQETPAAVPLTAQTIGKAVREFFGPEGL